MRDAFADAVEVPSLRSYRRACLAILLMAAAPMLALGELDREVVTAHLASPGRLVVDLVLAAYVTWELTRRTPRVPAAAAAALLAVAMRWGLVGVRQCSLTKGALGLVYALVYAAAGLAALAAFAVIVGLPTRARVVLELLDRLGITRAEAFAARGSSAPSRGVVGAAFAAAVGLPAVIVLARRAGVGPGAQAAVLVAYGALAPGLPARIARSRSGRVLPAPGPRKTRTPARIAVGVAAGGALAFALERGAHHFFLAGAELARCVGRLDAEGQRLLAREQVELGGALAGVRASTLMTALSVTVVPFVEERVYRATLQRALARAYGDAYGLFGAAALFGIAHAGLYQVALYETVLLGVAFGVAYAEGGLVAAVVVHALYNTVMLA